MGIFRFKKFEVINERSAMKVNTDGVLLGASMTLTSSDRRLLDIGTGTGTIALMAAQRLANFRNACLQPEVERTLSSEANCNRERHHRLEVSSETQNGAVWIDAIDIDEPSASEAAANFEHSPWADVLHAHNLSLDQFNSILETDFSPIDQNVESMATPSSQQADCKFDLIFSNPPYFEDSLTAPDERKSTARHTSDGLSYRDIFDFAKTHLSDSGRVALVLPADQESAICRYARMSGLHLFRVLRIRTVPRKAPSRIVIEFSRVRQQSVDDTVLTIQNEGQYTQEYLSLTKDFYLFA